MILLPCPHCGPRNVQEFRYAGETGPRPDPNVATPEEWRDYLYTADNPAGWVIEKWFHGTGCRRYFVVERNTATNEVGDSWLPATQKDSA